MRTLHPELKIPSPLHRFHLDGWTRHGVQVWVKRDDLIHPEIPGNKWRKLKHHLETFRTSGLSSIASFGGPYSNHLSALAAACFYMGIPSVGLVRGEITDDTPLFKTAQRFGMRIITLSRKDFDKRDDPSFQQKLAETLGFQPFFIPSGGEGMEGVLGCREIVSEIDCSFDFIVCPCGTGTTLAGLAAEMKDGQCAIGISVLKGRDTLSDKVKAYASPGHFKIVEGYHFGGFGKRTEELLAFIRKVQSDTDVPLDHVYTGKMVWAVDDLIRKGWFPEGSRIILLHTGGVSNAPVI